MFFIMVAVLSGAGYWRAVRSGWFWRSLHWTRHDERYLRDGQINICTAQYKSTFYVAVQHATFCEHAA
jgi:hypothetical protein